MQLLIRLSSGDHDRLKILAESLGGSRAQAVRFLIRQWFEQKKPNQPDIGSISQ
jgi:hypothetical protein